MARVFENEKGFKIIKCTAEEFAEIGSPCICDNCDAKMKGVIYYVAVLNRAFCEDCYNKWYDSARRYNEDVLIEMRNFYYYAGLLGM